MNSNRQQIPQGVKHIHFIGIGGSGMFPLVQILHPQGYSITGSDNNPSDIVDMVLAMGIPVKMGQAAENINGADLIVYSAAIMEDNPELVAAKASGIPLWERSKLLGVITGQYAHSICVAGTHGKTTTTALLTQILLGAGVDPTAVIGGKLPAIGGYGRRGVGEVMTCEACEYANTFLELSPHTALLLNVDNDHLEFFGSMEGIKAAFRQFSSLATGCILYNGDDQNTIDTINGLDNAPMVSFGLGAHNDYYAVNIVQHKGVRCSFDLMHKGRELCKMQLRIPGRHNVCNAVAAAAAAHMAGVSPEQIATHAEKFGGAGRRFEVMGEFEGITVVDDYAHHPAELKATLTAATEMDFERVWAVFQPFTYSRTAMLLEEFAEVLSIADRVVMSKIMGSREKNTYNIYTSDLADKIKGSVWFPEFEEMAEHVAQNAKPGDLIITLGCGDVYKCGRMICKLLDAKTKA